jgi:PKD repeat protein
MKHLLLTLMVFTAIPFTNYTLSQTFEIASNNSGNYRGFNRSYEYDSNPYTWSFGDGSTSTDFQPFHTYSVVGDYIVCLTRTLNGNSTTYCDTLLGAISVNFEVWTNQNCQANVTLGETQNGTFLVTDNSTTTSPMNQTYGVLSSKHSFIWDGSEPDMINRMQFLQRTTLRKDGSQSKLANVNMNQIHIYTYVLSDTLGGCRDTMKIQEPKIIVDNPIDANCTSKMKARFNFSDSLIYVKNISSANNPRHIYNYVQALARDTAGNPGLITAQSTMPEHTLYLNPDTTIFGLIILQTDATFGCSDFVVDTFVVTPNMCDANFYSTPGTQAMSYNFETKVIDPTKTYNWTFNNSASANGTEVSHTYTDPYLHIVKLDVLESGNVCATRIDTILVDTVCVANFYYEMNVNNDLEYQFMSTSSGSSQQYDWSFGDGSVNSTSMDQIHEYATYGDYTVCLEVSRFNCYDSICKIVQVQPSDTCMALFSVTQDSLVTSLYWGDDYSVGSNLTYAWDFGDGSAIDTARRPTHIYQNPGTYTICLTITSNGGLCVHMTCDTVIFTNKSLAKEYVVTFDPNYKPLGISEYNSATIKGLFPNPVEDVLTIQMENWEVMDEMIIQIVNLEGRIAKEIHSTPAATIQVDLSDIEKGIYLINVFNSIRDISSPQRIVKY